MTNTISKIIHNGDEFEFDTSSVSGITTTQPSNPTEGAVYYDTTNDVVKVYDGTNWNVVGDDAADINTKTFYLSSTSDLTTAQAVYDWFKAGKNPIIQKSNRIYILNGAPQNNRRLIFRNITQNDTYYQYAGAIIQDSLTIVSNSDIVSEIINNETIIGTLSTDVDYQTPYTPTYNGSPATKKYVDDTVASAKSSGATAPSNPTEGQLWYDTTNDVLKVYDGTNWVEVGKEYNAGEGIGIGTAHSDMQGPAPSGYHVPLTTEWQGLKTIMDGLSLTTGDGWRINLHMPFAGYRSYGGASLNVQGSLGFYWSSSNYSESSYNALFLNLNSSTVFVNNYSKRANCYSVRCFKDSYVAPDSSWTVIQGVLGSAGIFWNQSEGLISITNGTTGYTIMDKNLGATVVYSDGDTLSEANMGNMYQWGNNYGFPSTGTITNTSSTQVDASTYGPGNYYSDSTFITGNNDWSSVQNDNLWGSTSKGTWISNEGNTIINTGVLSVNGQTGDVVIDEGNTKTFYISSTSDLTNAQAAYDWYVAGKNPIVIYDNKPYSLRTADQYAMTFIMNEISKKDETSYTTIENTTISFALNSGNVENIITGGGVITSVLRAGHNYSTPYTPQYNGSPATKKYVDDHDTVISGDSGTTYTIKVSNSAPASGTPNSTITFVI